MKRPKSDFFFFWGHAFSQWGVYPMVIDGVTYCTAEQYMMAEKARLFGDTEILQKIMATSDPRQQKALGRRVKGFDKEKWEAVARDVVYRANLAKFTQNVDAFDLLMKKTGNRIIVEASPEDCIWGIGLHENDPRACDPDQWRGTNWLGEALMRVRQELRDRKIQAADVDRDWSDALAKKLSKELQAA